MNDKIRLEDAFEQMLSYRKAVGYATATYRSSIPPFISFCAEKYPDVHFITPEMVDEWIAFYPYSDNGRAVFISLLREFTKYLNFLGYEDFIPGDDYTVRRTAFHPYLFTDYELSAFFTAIDSYSGTTSGKRFHPEMILPVYSRLLYCCGMRPQEPPSLRMEDVNLETGDIYIRQSKRHKDRHIFGKGNKHRITPLSEEIWKQYNSYCESGYHLTKNPEDLVFYSYRNGQKNKMSSDNVSRILFGCEEKVRTKNPELIHLHSHIFRRTRAMHLYQAGMPLPTISEWLGHSNIETTRFYAKVTEEMKRDALHKLSESADSVFKDDTAFKYADDEDMLKRLCGLK